MSERVPWWLDLVGVAPVVEKLEQPTMSYGTWGSCFGRYRADMWIKHPAPAWNRSSEPVRVDVGGGSTEIRRDASRIVLGALGCVDVANPSTCLDRTRRHEPVRQGSRGHDPVRQAFADRVDRVGPHA
jgi:hypothetical protein